MSRSFTSCLAFLFAGAAAAPLAAAAPTRVAPDRNATAAVNIYQPIGVQKNYDLDFGLATVTTAGTAVVDPNTDKITTTGGVVAVGGFPHSAVFEGVTPTGNVVIIRLPKAASVLTRVGGTQTMTVDTWTLDGTSRRNVPSKSTYAFKVGGTLHVNANQVEGTYVGTFTVDVQYP
ncbi:uncharacterized protein DUF4402 [Sphingomonas sp. F9_3S_D5_B_2]